MRSVLHTRNAVEISLGLSDGQANRTLGQSATVPMVNDLFGGAAATYSNLTSGYVVQEVFRLSAVRQRTQHHDVVLLVLAFLALVRVGQLLHDFGDF